MKIAHFSDNFYPEISGITDSIITSSKALAALGHEVMIFAPKYSKKDYQTAHLPRSLDLGPNIKIVRYASLPYPAGTGQARLVLPTGLRWLKMKQNRPDIIHTHLFFGVGLEALAAAKFLKIPLVGTNHTPITEFMRYSPVKSALISRFTSHAVSAYYNKCKFVSAPSQNLLNEMRLNGLKSPNQKIPNAIEVERFRPPTAEENATAKKHFQLNGPTILYTGRLAEEKHIDIILKAFQIVQRHIPNAHLALTGVGSEESKLHALAHELKLNNTKFFGMLENKEFEKIHAAADIFTIASTAETQSLSLMQAMAAGLPVVGANARALPEYINSKNGILFEPGDFEALAKNIIKLLNNPELSKSLGTNGSKYALSLSPRSIALKWMEIYAANI